MEHINQHFSLCRECEVGVQPPFLDTRHSGDQPSPFVTCKEATSVVPAILEIYSEFVFQKQVDNLCTGMEGRTFITGLLR